MAASYTLESDKFPNGTTVYANAVGTQDPPVSAVVSNGQAVFQGLREFHDYQAHARIGVPDVDGAGSTYVAVTFTTGAGAGGGGGVTAMVEGPDGYVEQPAARPWIGWSDPTELMDELDVYYAIPEPD